jgi:adenylate cyclase
MTEPFQNSAWLEQPGGDRADIKGTCSIGRVPSNHIVLADEKVSRRHAVIHAQDQNEFWLVDLGSSNGTYLNRRRVAQPVQLRDQDEIEIGPFRLVFRDPQSPQGATPKPIDDQKTLHEIKPIEYWLVLADIQSSTELSRRLSPQELPVLTGRWFDSCKQIIDATGGSIDKFLGDGFLACWHSGDKTAARIARALTGLKTIQASAQLAFRVVVHHGRVFTGGATASGVERLFGPEINFVFRMERLASVLGASCVLSEPAQRQIQSHLATGDLGQHELSGFDGRFAFFSF